jgi:nucleoside-diphosphate-sugar epimerase
MAGGRGVVVITGGSGRLGGAAALRMQRAGYAVVAFDRAGPPHPPEGVETVEVDLTSDDAVRDAFAAVRQRHGGRIASVLHFAAFYDLSGAPSPSYDAINVQGTGRLLEALRPFAVEQFVFASTMIVHAPCAPGERIDENSPLDPKWEYPRSKRAAEDLLRARRGDIPLVILRLASVYDEATEHPLLAEQLRRVAERRLTGRVYPGDPARGQAYLHREDLLDAIGLAVDRRASLPPETILLLGEPEVPGYGAIQAELGRLLHGRPWPTHRVPKALARLGARVLAASGGNGEGFAIRPWMVDLADDHFALDVGRARDLLGWEPRHALRHELPRLVAAYRRDPAWWYRANGLTPPRGVA